MKQDFINKIQDIIGNQSTDEREMLFQLKGVLYETELQNQTARESKSIADLVSENLTQLKEETHQGNTIKQALLILTNYLVVLAWESSL